ncbi:hypothetical protein J1614_004710 [Plenodomus biglobosus]|nr:hypothetical protein J1614_004710 [Plenodomus biglobosus]
MSDSAAPATQHKSNKISKRDKALNLLHTVVSGGSKPTTTTTTTKKQKENDKENDFICSNCNFIKWHAGMCGGCGV